MIWTSPVLRMPSIPVLSLCARAPLRGMEMISMFSWGWAVESVSAFYDIVIEYAQGAEMYFFSVVPVTEAKGMMAVEPAEIDMASFGGG